MRKMLSTFIFMSIIYGYVIRLVPVCESQKVTGAPLAQFINTNISKVKTSVEGKMGYTTNLNECKPLNKYKKPKSYGIIGSTGIKEDMPSIKKEITLKNNKISYKATTTNSKKINAYSVPNTKILQPKANKMEIERIKQVDPVYVQPQKAQIVVPKIIQPKIVQPPVYVQPQKAQIVVPKIIQPKIIQSPVVVQPKIIQQPPKIIQQPPKIIQQPPKIIQQPPKIIQQPPKIIQQPPKIIQNPKIIQQPVVMQPQQPIIMQPRVMVQSPVVMQPNIYQPQFVNPEMILPPMQQSMYQSIYQPVYPTMYIPNYVDCTKYPKLQFCITPKKKRNKHTITNMATYLGGTSDAVSISPSISSTDVSSKSSNSMIIKNSHESKEDYQHIKLFEAESKRKEDKSSDYYIDIRNFCNMNIEPQIKECKRYKISSLVLDTERQTISYNGIEQILRDGGIYLKDLVKFIDGSKEEDLLRLNEAINNAFEMSRKSSENEKIICSVSSRINICFSVIFDKNSEVPYVQHRKSKSVVFNLSTDSFEDIGKNIIAIGTKNNDLVTKKAKSESIQYRKQKNPSFIEMDSESEDLASTSGKKRDPMLNNHTPSYKEEDDNIPESENKSKKESCEIGSESYNREDCIKIIKMSDLIKGNTLDPCLDFFKNRTNQISNGNFEYGSMMEPNSRKNGDSFVYLSELI